MALSYEFIMQRAEQAAQDAAGSALDNVRDRALRSEAAWRVMANQILELTQNREMARQARRLERAARSDD